MHVIFYECFPIERVLVVMKCSFRLFSVSTCIDEAEIYHKILFNCPNRSVGLFMNLNVDPYAEEGTRWELELLQDSLNQLM